MAIYDVTPELAETIKTVRVQNHITSKSVAEHIGKSQSYMSKLEKGDIKSIHERELTKVFRFIFGSDKGFQDFLNSALGTILSTLELRFSDEEIKEQLWFDNYDTVLRKIPIPGEMVFDINARMQALGLSNAVLCARINANEGISPAVTNKDNYPFNEWQAFVVDHKIEFTFIKMKVDDSEINSILSRETSTTNYVTMLAIVYYIKKTEKHQFEIEIDENDERAIMKEAQDFLGSHKFYSIAEKNRLRRQAHTRIEYEERLSSFDKENIAIINEMLASFRIFSEIDITHATKLISLFVDNLNWDSSFMMQLISSPFAKLNNMSYRVKKQILSEILDIIAKYKALPDEQKRIEIYD